MNPSEYFDLIDYRWNCSDCRKHSSPFNKEDVERVVAFGGRCCCRGYNEKYETCNSWCDTDSYAVFKLKDGRFATFWEGSDSSGHG